MAAGKKEGEKISEAGPLVFMITRADEPGGAQQYVLELASRLKTPGEKVVVFTGEGGFLQKALSRRGVSCRELKHLVHPISPLKDLAAFLEIRKQLKALKPALLSTHSNKAGLIGRLAAKSLRVPAVHTSHGFLFGGREKTFSGLFYRLMEKIGSAAAEKVVAVSESEAALARKFKVISREKLAVIHNGLPDVDESLIADPTAEPPQLVMVARFARPKDHHTLLAALGDLKEYPWQLTLVGEGPGLAEAKKFARQLNINERVAFLGTRDDVPHILANAQAFVLSTQREGFPLSVLEAMRAGLPVVASRVGGVPEAIQDGENGSLFAPGDKEQLKQILKVLLADPGKRKKMGEVGRKLFLERFTLDKVFPDIYALYKEIALKAGEGEQA
ncbi:MAG: glycosyltransferase family 4 protein [Bacillota bacterium]